MITGTHVMLNTTEPEALRAWFKDVFGWHHVDAGGGWLIFRVPPAELGVHPADQSGAADLFFLCDDIEQTRKELEGKGVDSTDVEDLRFGLMTYVTAPGNTRIGIYQPKHPVAADIGSPE